MKTKKNFAVSFLIMIFAALPPISLSMPTAGAEEGGDDNPAAETTAPIVAAPTEIGQPAQAAFQPESAKTPPLTWPDTTVISEDNKKLLQSNNKEIVQLFTQAQEVCKNMDDTLSALNTQRDAANTQYRDSINELDPLLQRIGAAQATHKK